MEPNGQPPRTQRCAIYTRKSVSQGLDQEFNSLETQRAICSAYITSQTPRGWREIPKRYDDGGQSGATLDRPSLRELLSDIELGLVDIVVVYKLDRITRSLLHFVRLTEFLEARETALVSITQMFDSSDSMGRLILNVLLTFAQFEREIASDRIRDKQRVIRQSGRWYAGNPPLGYRTRNRILQVDASEAAHVRFIFERYVALDSFKAVAGECQAHDMRSRRYKGKSGQWHGGRVIGPAGVRFILDNPVYIGLLRCGEDLVEGLHEPIIERALWDKAQALCSVHSTRQRHPNLLTGILHDCYGRPMSVTSHAKIKKVYASRFKPHSRCRKKALRARKEDIESLVLATLEDLLSNEQLIRSGLLELGRYDERLDELVRKAEAAAASLGDLPPRELAPIIRAIFLRVELAPDRLRLVVSWRAVERLLEWDRIGSFDGDAAEPNRSPVRLLEIPWRPLHRTILTSPVEPRRADATPAPALLKLLSDAGRTRALIEENRTASVNELASQMGCERDRFIRLHRLNYLAPDILTGILDGTQPPDLTPKKLIRSDLPLDWALQRRLLGFPARADN